MPTIVMELQSGASLVCCGSMARLVAWVDDNLTGKISVDRLCRQAGLPADRLERLVRDRTGRSLRGFIADRRVDFACCRLAMTDHGLAAVAALSGYSSLAAMKAAFRRSLSMTPSAFRMTCRTT